MLSEEQVRHIAKLARIALSDKEVKKLQMELSDVLSYVEILGEVDTTGVQETSQVTGLNNVMEKDEIISSKAKREQLIACSELPVEGNQIRVLKIIK